MYDKMISDLYVKNIKIETYFKFLNISSIIKSVKKTN